MNAVDRFLDYVSYNTMSDPKAQTRPSTGLQFILLQHLCSELDDIGAENVRMGKECNVYAEIPATPGCENEPTIGLIAHVDTSPALSGENVVPRIVKNYDGGEIALGQSGYVMNPKEFPSLKDYIGQDLIVTDGNTLLGADDKAGVAEIMAAAEILLSDNTIPHGKVVIAFTPDEEIGSGADGFDIEGFGADFAYTIDGGKLGELEMECFNAAAADIDIKGFSIHPGDAKNKMINAARIAAEFVSLMPLSDTPEHTEGYEGFFHLCEISGSEDSAHLEYIIRDFDASKLQWRKDFMVRAAAMLNTRYGEGTVNLTITDSYRNMYEMVSPHPETIDRAKAAFSENGVEIIMTPIRGGTDGARLSWEGLPCPNLSTGGHNFHGRFEYIPVQSLEKMTDVIISLVSKR